MPAHSHQYLLISLSFNKDNSFFESYHQILIDSILFLIGLMIVLLTYILIALIIKRRNERLRKRFSRITDLLIQRAIFYDEEELPELSLGVSRLLKIKLFRCLLTEEILKAKRNFSGSAANNLRLLYLECNLDYDSQKKLHSSKWNVKAQGIQELAEMGQQKAFDQIFELTNNKNEQVRIEAQNAVVIFSGLNGLNFLDFLTYPLSDWQQIKLIGELGDATEESSNYIKKWIGSSNNSVVIFALKLAARYHHFELHDRVTLCLSHPSAEVRNHAIKTLKEIFDESTAASLVKLYNNEGLNNQLEILDVLKEIGTESEIPFLMNEFQKEDHKIKLAAGRAIANIKGIEILESSEFAPQYPWDQIIQQIKGELTE